MLVDASGNIAATRQPHLLQIKWKVNLLDAPVLIFREAPVWVGVAQVERLHFKQRRFAFRLASALFRSASPRHKQLHRSHGRHFIPEAKTLILRL